jgi:rhodanese-related sulfurtransferase
MQRFFRLTLAVALAVALALVLVLLVHSSNFAKPPYRTLTAPEANAVLTFDTTTIVLDVRTKEEYDGTKGHLKNARLIPVQELPKRWKELKPFAARQIMVYCCQCPRSAEAAQILVSKGFKTVMKIDGGIDTWTESKLPVELSANAPKDGSTTTCSIPKTAGKVKKK